MVIIKVPLPPKDVDKAIDFQYPFLQLTLTQKGYILLQDRHKYRSNKLNSSDIYIPSTVDIKSAFFCTTKNDKPLYKV